MIAQRKPSVNTVKSCKPKIMRPAFTRETAASTSSVQSSQDKRVTRGTSVMSLNRLKLNNLSFPAMPALGSGRKDNADELFREKLKLCPQMCDFESGETDQFIMAKEDVLKDVLAGLKNSGAQISNDLENWKAVVGVISAHVFRRPPPIPEEWFGFLDFYCLTDEVRPPEWVHLSLVYDIAIEWMNCMKVDSKEKFVLAGDVLKLCVYLARTPDDREQEKIAVLFSAIYEKVPQSRAFAFKFVSNALSRIVFDDEPFTSAKPLLKAFTSIIAGLSNPLNEKYLPFWYNVLLPLHRCEHLVYFAKELFTCVAQVLERNHRLVIDVFKNLMKFWPRLNPHKQMLFLDEITYLCSFVEDEDLEQCIRIICPQLLLSLTSCHAAVAEKILLMWEVNDFVWFMITDPGITYPLLIPKLLETGKTYWQPDIRILSAAVMAVMQVNQEKYFDAVGKNMKKIVSHELCQGMTRASKWKYLISNFEEDRKRRKTQLHILSVLFAGCESIDPWKPPASGA